MRDPTGNGLELLERDAQLERWAAVLAAAGQGSGAMVVVEGPAGAGKTALLDGLGGAARATGAKVRLARGTELERDFAFGGARQLLVEDGASARPDTLAAGAGPALPVLADGEAELAPPPAFAELEGLSAVLETLADQGVVALLVDDAQWLDAPTLRWLDFLRGRVTRMPVIVVLAVRSAAARRPQAPLHQVLADPNVELWPVAPLGEAAIATLLAARLGKAPEPSLVTECARVTAGNAFAVRELIAALELDGESVGMTGRLTHRVPATIARSIRGRLARLDADAIRVAGVLAVLGDGAPVHRVASLAALPADRVLVAADTLAGAELIAPERPLAFVHPLVRSAIEADLTSGERSRLHARAAQRLTEEDADAEAVAAHLLRTDPVGSEPVVTALRGAAALALRRGAPDSAVVYLQRALAEPPVSGERVAVSHELGRAELAARLPNGVPRLREAFERAVDPLLRARIGTDLFDAMTFVGQWHDAGALVRSLRDELGDRLGGAGAGAVLALDLRVALGMLERNDALDSPEVRRLETLAETAPDAAPLRLLLALLSALRGERCADVPALVATGLDGGRFLAEHSADSILAVHAIDALVFCDALDEADAFLAEMAQDAQRRGLVLGALAVHTHRGLVALRRGALADAEPDLRLALAMAGKHELHFTLPFVCGYLGETLLLRGALDEAAAVVGLVPAERLALTSAGAATLLAARGGIALARGEPAAAAADLRACGTHAEAIAARNPLVQPWRSLLARALVAQEAAGSVSGPGSGSGSAEDLAAEELALARRAGLDRGIGVALRARGLVVRGPEGITNLEQAIDVLRRSPAVVELALTLADLGSALRRAGRVADARAPLREALDIATRTGAAGLAATVTAELHVAGGRPRSPWLRGVEALTPSELRVARLASRGMTNSAIAAELVISAKTVKHHLGAVYRKLDISTRAELGAVGLDASAPGETGETSVERHQFGLGARPTRVSGS